MGESWWRQSRADRLVFKGRCHLDVGQDDCRHDFHVLGDVLRREAVDRETLSVLGPVFLIAEEDAADAVTLHSLSPPLPTTKS